MVLLLEVFYYNRDYDKISFLINPIDNNLFDPKGEALLLRRLAQKRDHPAAGMKFGSLSSITSNTSRQNGMRTLVFRESESLAVDVRFDKDRIHIRLKDGREISVHLEWFPRLKDASPKQRKNWRLIGKGIGIHWPDLDEDISVSALLK